MREQETIVKAWITGNLISFKKPKYKSAFFEAEEVFVIRKNKSNGLSKDLSKETIEFINNLLT